MTHDEDRALFQSCRQACRVLLFVNLAFLAMVAVAALFSAEFAVYLAVFFAIEIFVFLVIEVPLFIYHLCKGDSAKIAAAKAIVGLAELPQQLSSGW